MLVNHGRFHIDAARLSQIVGQAYDIQTVRVLGGPGWMSADLYDIVAKTGNVDAGENEVRAMLRALLAERFKLAVHRETKELPLYTLVVAKNGPKLPEAKAEDKQFFESGQGPGGLEEGEYGGIRQLSGEHAGQSRVGQNGAHRHLRFQIGVDQIHAFKGRTKAGSPPECGFGAFLRSARCKSSSG